MLEQHLRTVNRKNLHREMMMKMVNQSIIRSQIWVDYFCIIPMDSTENIYTLTIQLQRIYPMASFVVHSNEKHKTQIFGSSSHNKSYEIIMKSIFS